MQDDEKPAEGALAGSPEREKAELLEIAGAMTGSSSPMETGQ
jgi:hypothetical protein